MELVFSQDSPQQSEPGLLPWQFLFVCFVFVLDLFMITSKEEICAGLRLAPRLTCLLLQISGKPGARDPVDVCLCGARYFIHKMQIVV
jgi:hypothetical protein